MIFKSKEAKAREQLARIKAGRIKEQEQEHKQIKRAAERLFKRDHGAYDLQSIAQNFSGNESLLDRSNRFTSAILPLDAPEYVTVNDHQGHASNIHYSKDAFAEAMKHKQFSKVKSSYSTLTKKAEHQRNQLRIIKEVSDELIKSPPDFHNYQAAAKKMESHTSDIDKDSKKLLDGMIRQALVENKKLLKSKIESLESDKKDLAKSEKAIERLKKDYNKLEKQYQKSRKTSKSAETLLEMQETLNTLKATENTHRDQLANILAKQSGITRDLSAIGLPSDEHVTVGMSKQTLAAENSFRKLVHQFEFMQVKAETIIHPEVPKLLSELAKSAEVIVRDGQNIIDPEVMTKWKALADAGAAHAQVLAADKPDPIYAEQTLREMVKAYNEINPPKTSTPGATTASHDTASDQSDLLRFITMAQNSTPDLSFAVINAQHYQEKMTKLADDSKQPEQRFDVVAHEHYYKTKDTTLTSQQKQTLHQLHRDMEVFKSEMMRRAGKLHDASSDLRLKVSLSQVAHKAGSKAKTTEALTKKYASKSASRVKKIESDTKKLHALLDRYVAIKKEAPDHHQLSSDQQLLTETQLLVCLRTSIEEQVDAYAHTYRALYDMVSEKPLEDFTRSEKYTYDSLCKSLDSLKKNIQSDLNAYEEYTRDFSITPSGFSENQQWYIDVIKQAGDKPSTPVHQETTRLEAEEQDYRQDTGLNR